MKPNKIKLLCSQVERKVRYVVQTMQDRAKGLQAEWGQLTAA
jgi:hypothetical protein